MTTGENDDWRWKAVRRRKWNTVSGDKLVKFVVNNPGLTASMIAILWRRPYGTISSVLHGLVVGGRLSRVKSHGMRGGKNVAWRYYPDAATQAVDELLQTKLKT